ncbi:hypothetical protein COCOBI_02-7910 [Coccomyxa sp. Obi]|nr:hypothetical protein COCOBI_02-7910 [Coccomyxa sp. Obi]
MMGSSSYGARIVSLCCSAPDSGGQAFLYQGTTWIKTEGGKAAPRFQRALLEDSRVQLSLSTTTASSVSVSSSPNREPQSEFSTSRLPSMALESSSSSSQSSQSEHLMDTTISSVPVSLASTLSLPATLGRLRSTQLHRLLGRQLRQDQSMSPAPPGTVVISQGSQTITVAANQQQPVVVIFPQQGSPSLSSAPSPDQTPSSPDGSSPSASPLPSDTPASPSPAASPADDSPSNSPSPSPDSSSQAAASDSPAPPPPSSPRAQQALAPVIVTQGNQTVTLQSSGQQQPIVVIFPQQGAPAPDQASPAQTVQLSKSGVGATPLPLQVNTGQASSPVATMGTVNLSTQAQLLADTLFKPTPDVANSRVAPSSPVSANFGKAQAAPTSVENFALGQLARSPGSAGDATIAGGRRHSLRF